MRITYRGKDIKQYWEDRWTEIPADRPIENMAIYPIKYAEMTITSPDGKILEAGCGAGRILRHYHQRGYRIVGMDYAASAIEKLKVVDASLQVEMGDIRALNYPDGTFRYVLAFGLYHNLEDGLEQAFKETYRVLESGGKVCASFRADNVQTRLTDWLADYRERQHGEREPRTHFHKLNLTASELHNLFQQAGFVVENFFPVENMPILYKFAFFRAQSHQVFNENLARKEGYLLSPLGKWIQGGLMRLFPNQFCNVYVLIARRP